MLNPNQTTNHPLLDAFDVLMKELDETMNVLDAEILAGILTNFSFKTQDEETKYLKKKTNNQCIVWSANLKERRPTLYVSYMF